MKLLLTIFLFWLYLAAAGQSFTRVDSWVMNVKCTTTPLLAKELTRYCTTDLERVRAIFKWITSNIDYRVRARPMHLLSKKGDQPDDDTAALLPLEERVAENVLQTKETTCYGYALLFKALCNHAGVRAEVITGYGRTEFNRSAQRFKSNHNWNAVWIDSSWKLLDVTWASGFLSYRGDSYVRSFDETYFLMSPEQFIKDHFPDDVNWALIKETPVLPEFKSSPYRQKTFAKYKITAYLPAKGIIEASLGDTIQLQLDIADGERDRRIGADPFLDTSMFITPVAALLSPSSVQSSPFRVNYTYCAASPGVQWLYVLYNRDIILRYRLIIKT